VNKTEFLNELRYRLRRLPAQEINSAMNYYEEYLNDAVHAQNEAGAIAALGSPAAVAAKLIGEYAVSDAEVVKEKPKKTNSFWIVLLAVFASPIAFPLVAAVFAVAISLFAAVFAVGSSFIIFSAAGIVSMIAGVWVISVDVAVGLFYLGTGMLMLAAGLTMTALIYKLAKALFVRLQKSLGNMLIKKGRQTA